MPLLVYHCSTLDISIDIESSLQDVMIVESRKHFPNEFGGILLGHYSDDLGTAMITDIILPKEFKSSRFSFIRGNKGIKARLEREYEKVPSTIYLGEWHTHPNSTPAPSQIDLNTLIQLSKSKTVLIENPIMLIIGLEDDRCDMAFYTIKNKVLYQYERKN